MLIPSIHPMSWDGHHGNKKAFSNTVFAAKKPDDMQNLFLVRLAGCE